MAFWPNVEPPNARQRKGKNEHTTSSPALCRSAGKLYLGIGRLDATGSAAELRRLHEQCKRDIILLNRAANALAMMDWKADPTLSSEIRERLMHSGALPDLID